MSATSLPSQNLKDRLRWLLSQRCIGLMQADEIVRLSSNLLSRVDMLDASMARLVDLYEAETAPTPEHAQAWEEARNIMGVQRASLPSQSGEAKR